MITVREPPLLNAPHRSEEWMRVTNEDVNISREWLNIQRGYKFNGFLGNGLIQMRSLGIAEAVLGTDRECLLRGLKRARAQRNVRGFGYGLAEEVYLVNALVRVEMPAEDDKTSIHRALEICRNTPNGRSIAQIMYWMKETGIATQNTEEDSRIISDDLAMLREGVDTTWFLRTLFNMRRIGLKAELTRDDLEKVKKSLQDYRTRRDGYFLINGLYFLNELRKNEPENTTQMPPLKRFGGGV